ncbi:hypothetical protein ACTL6P_11940 [Endozoicomonas acroporae]|uniref:hypothetical protein n=1 Tax=Endozoicomonas acroporae TaxID=1701104 RepID=UPI000C75F4B2|nr:hypothetical protein [Endozoicomonas acroporae]
MAIKKYPYRAKYKSSVLYKKDAESGIGHLLQPAGFSSFDVSTVMVASSTGLSFFFSLLAVSKGAASPRACGKIEVGDDNFYLCFVWKTNLPDSARWLP